MPESILVPQGQRRGLNRHANCYNPSLYNANEVVNATNSALLASSGAHPPLRERSGFIVDQTCNEGDHCQHLPTHLLYCRDTSSAPAIGSTEHRHLAETKSSSAVEFEGTVRTHSVLPIIFATIDGIFSGIVLLACSLSTPTPVRPITPSYRCQTRRTRKIQTQRSDSDENRRTVRGARTLVSRSLCTSGTTRHHPSQEQVN